MTQTPLLILSDAPTSGTGLGRITRDLAARIAEHLPEFRVATIGYGGPNSRKLPFPQYGMEMKDWVVFNLPDVWQDFAGDEKGVILTIWDASRMLWFSRPENVQDERLRMFLTRAPFSRWGYFPLDATGPNDKLTLVIKHTIAGYNRVLAYSKWAEDILSRTLEVKAQTYSLNYRPHGIDTSVFRPRERHAARHGFGERIGAKNAKGKFLNIPDDNFLVGIVATNQARKDWGLGIASVAEIAKERNVMLWCHIDVLERNWSLPALLNDFGLVSNTVVTCLELSDEQMSWCYSACDVTLGIGLGEGFGYPIFESLACGTPCIHGNYGGAAEHLPDVMLVDPAAPFRIEGPYTKPHDTPFRIEGPYNCYRPVYEPKEWAGRALSLMGAKNGHSLLPFDLDWNNLWPKWAEWLKEGQ